LSIFDVAIFDDLIFDADTTPPTPLAPKEVTFGLTPRFHHKVKPLILESDEAGFMLLTHYYRKLKRKLKANARTIN
jgi:hypothetical protein